MSEESPDRDDGGTDPGDDGGARNRLEARTERAIEGFDQGVIDLLAWLLDTETRARIYVHLRKEPRSTSEEIADGTGLYPSTVREALAELHDEGLVDREKRNSDGAGNNPYEYTAIPPSDLVRDAAREVQDQLNAICNLDRGFDRPTERESEPVRIEVRGEDDDPTER